MSVRMEKEIMKELEAIKKI